MRNTMRKTCLIGLIVLLLFSVNSVFAETHDDTIPNGTSMNLSGNFTNGNNERKKLNVNVIKRDISDSEIEVTVTVHNPFSYSVRDVVLRNILPEGLQYMDSQEYTGCFFNSVPPNGSVSQVLYLRKAKANAKRAEAEDTIRVSVEAENSYAETDTAVMKVTVENLSSQSLKDVSITNSLPYGLVYPNNKDFEGVRINSLFPFEVKHMNILVQKGNTNQLQKADELPLNKVPPELQNMFTSVEQIKDRLSSKVSSLFVHMNPDNFRYFNIKLMISSDGGRNWKEATKEDFPKEGIKVLLPYPPGTNGKQYRFVVSHMYTVSYPERGWYPGQIDLPPVTWNEDGIWVTFRGLSPVAIGWEKIDETSAVIPQTGDNSGFVFWIVLMSFSAGAVVWIQMKRHAKI